MGGIKSIVALLESNSHEVAAHAARSLMEISRDHPSNQKLVVDYSLIALMGRAWPSLRRSGRMLLLFCLL